MHTIISDYESVWPQNKCRSVTYISWSIDFALYMYLEVYLIYKCNRWKNSNHQCSDQGSNLGRLRDRRTLYRVAIKAGLYRKAVQVYHIPITTTYSPPFLDSSANLKLSNHSIPSLLGHQAHQIGLFTLGARCNRWKNSNHQCRDRGSNLGHLRDRRTLYRVAIKAGLYRKAVQVYHIPITTT